MSHLIISNLTKTVGEKTLFENISFTINNQNRAGLIGINGTGKSTFLSIIAGQLEADSIDRDHPNKFRIAYLEQQPVFEKEETVLQTVFSGDSPILKINREYEEALLALMANSDSTELQNRLMDLQQKMDELQAWDVNALAKTALTKLGITQFEDSILHLSGGQQKRVALAKVLIEPADLLLLDEPTNHLDKESTDWLQDMLQKVEGAIIFVTHDRYFLDTVATHIYELADKTLYTHTGNYADYLESKAIREEMNAASQQKLQNLYRNELKWIRRGAKARSTKQKARKDRFEEIDSQLDRDNSALNLELEMATTRLGKQVLEGKNISKRFDAKVIVDDFSFILQAGDRVGIVGPNGVGKSTLLKMLAGEIQMDSGEVVVGSTVKQMHFSQQLPKLNEQMRMIEYVRESSNLIEVGSGEKFSAAQMLERFLFPLNTHGTQIGKLSGGEKKRLVLLKMLMEQPNVLFLDEPTNDLDIQTLSVLEDFMESFPGVIITISHDRFFLDRIAKKLWILNGDGLVREWLGIYSDYLEDLKDTSKKVVEVRKDNAPVKSTKEKKKLTYKEQREWDTISEDIEKTERLIEELEQKLLTTGSDFTSLQQLTEQLDQANEVYEKLIERWSYLEEIVSS
ncbi:MULTISPECIES: ABC-F family ATP-binding cassette domain-containing protein [unclassified Psychrobacillus]|uniref:ABC-F family ATP-binding cassette domain-containing protein n=1 Tax=unclassified Psychrobacillus TaxID=2636677 RepID=UPI00146D0F2F|nr:MULTISPECIES: ABC-F family ATP-binding cassette domain-containing protein [unclassified Psychrobacillus]MCM3359165.1 ABC-F family ATP-binding cassette domain-containing protein [Psychrobacillus sp. MER TA 171]NME06414.1 ABC-F family ATP-binding cassette domain-containing protein [Psychrobacillus sp. BL-248-WT-3]